MTKTIWTIQTAHGRMGEFPTRAEAFDFIRLQRAEFRAAGRAVESTISRVVRSHKRQARMKLRECKRIARLLDASGYGGT